MFYRKTIKRANLFIFLTKKIFALFPADPEQWLSLIQIPIE